MTELVDPQLQEFFDSNPEILRPPEPELLVSAGKVPAWYDNAVVELAGAILAVRGIIALGLLRDGPPPPGTVQNVAQQQWALYSSTWLRFTVPAMKQIYSAGRIRGLTDVEMEAMATDYAAGLGEYLDETSGEALAEGFQAQLDDRWDASLAWHRAATAYGLDRPDMRSYLRTVLNQPKNQRDPVGTGAKMLVDRLLIARADRVAKAETWTANQTGLATSWIIRQQRGEISPDATRRWRTRHGETVCEVCAPLDGQEVGLAEPFTSAVGDLFAPGAHPGCMCSQELVEPVSKAWEHEARDSHGRWASLAGATADQAALNFAEATRGEAIEHGALIHRRTGEVLGVTHGNANEVHRTQPPRPEVTRPSSPFLMDRLMRNPGMKLTPAEESELRATRALPMEETAHIHSHPGRPPFPSAADIDEFAQGAKQFYIAGSEDGEWVLNHFSVDQPMTREQGQLLARHVGNAWATHYRWPNEPHRLLSVLARHGVTVRRVASLAKSKRLPDGTTDPYDRRKDGRFARHEERTRNVTHLAEETPPAVQAILDQLREFTDEPVQEAEKISPFEVDRKAASPFAQAGKGSPFEQRVSPFEVATASPFGVDTASPFDRPSAFTQGPGKVRPKRKMIVHHTFAPGKKPGHEEEYERSYDAHYLHADKLHAVYEESPRLIPLGDLFDFSDASANNAEQEIGKGGTSTEVEAVYEAALQEQDRDRTDKPPPNMEGFLTPDYMPPELLDLFALDAERTNDAWKTLGFSDEYDNSGAGGSEEDWRKVLPLALEAFDDVIENPRTYAEKLSPRELQHIYEVSGYEYEGSPGENDDMAKAVNHIVLRCEQHGRDDDSLSEAFADYVVWNRQDLLGSTGAGLARKLEDADASYVPEMTDNVNLRRTTAAHQYFVFDHGFHPETQMRGQRDETASLTGFYKVHHVMYRSNLGENREDALAFVTGIRELAAWPADSEGNYLAEGWHQPRS